MSCAPPSTCVPPVSTAKPSPPVARKLFTVTRYVLAGFCTTPLMTSISGGPLATGGSTVTSVGTKRTDVIFEQAGAAASQVYEKPLEICRMRCVAWPRQPTNCCSSRFLICWVLSVIVTRLLPKGCTVKALP